MPMLRAALDFLFGCRHSNLSRVFTVRRRTYKVCLDCGAEFDYSMETMSISSCREAGPAEHWSPITLGDTR